MGIFTAFNLSIFVPSKANPSQLSLSIFRDLFSFPCSFSQLSVVWGHNNPDTDGTQLQVLGRPSSPGNLPLGEGLHIRSSPAEGVQIICKSG